MGIDDLVSKYLGKAPSYYVKTVFRLPLDPQEMETQGESAIENYLAGAGEVAYKNKNCYEWWVKSVYVEPQKVWRWIRIDY